MIDLVSPAITTLFDRLIPRRMRAKSPEVYQVQRRPVILLPLDFRIEQRPAAVAICVRCYVINFQRRQAIEVVGGEVTQLAATSAMIDRIPLRGITAIPAQGAAVLSFDREITADQFRALTARDGPLLTATLQATVQYQRPRGGTRAVAMEGAASIQGLAPKLPPTAEDWQIRRY